MQRTLRLALALSSLLLCAAPGLAAPQDVLTAHDVAAIRSVTSALVSPDGAKVAYLLLVPRKPLVDDDGTPWSELHVLDTTNGTSLPFVTGKVNVSALRWTKDGSAIAFLAKRGDDKFTALYVIPLAGGEARRAVALGNSISAFDLAPDGARVALVAAPAEDEARKKARDKGFAQEVYEEDLAEAKVWTASLVDEAVEPVMLELEGHVHQIHWSPVDDRLAISVAPTPLVDDELMGQRIRVIDAHTGATLAKLENPGKLGHIEWSPDGKLIAAIAAGDLNDTAVGRLLVAPSTGGALVDLISNYQGHVAQLAWQDATNVMYVASEGVWTVFGKVDASAMGGAKPKVLVPAGGPILADLSLSEDGQHAAFVASSPAHPPELYTMSHGDAGPTRRTISNPWLAEKRLAVQEVVAFKARDGMTIEGILVRPLEAVEGKRFPLILYVHGGPEAHHSNGWLTSYGDPAQTAAARGFAVFHTNYRGSTGRGVAFAKISQGDPAGKEFDDLIDAVDYLVGTGLVDPEKVGVTGGSYGGYATAWLSTYYSERIAAGVMFVGISDKVSKVGTTDIPNEEYYVHARMRPWEDWQKLLERSPIYHAGKCKTPLVILHGKDDPRVNPGQSRELYRHLKLHGQAPVRLVLYPGEGHGNRKAAARLDYNLRMMQWFEHYLLGPGGEMPPYEIDYADPRDVKAAEAQAAEASAAR